MNGHWLVGPEGSCPARVLGSFCRGNRGNYFGQAYRVGVPMLHYVRF